MGETEDEKERPTNQLLIVDFWLLNETRRLRALQSAIKNQQPAMRFR
jgi:hypothetical protein